MALNYDALIKTIEDLAPPFLQASWDCSGLQVASTRKKIRKLAVCLDAVPSIVEKAIDLGCDFILAHHPLTLKAELPNQTNAYWRILQMLLTQDIPLYSAHTSLDVNINGPAGFLGRALKLKNTEILDPVSSPSFHMPCGYGQVGDLPEPLSLNGLVSQLMEILHIDVVPICGLYKKDIIRRIAYCGGSGSSLAAKALSLGADVFITGDVKYHTALETELGILDVGHYSMEAEMMRHMMYDLSTELKDLELIFLSSPDPFHFIYKI